MIRVGDFKISHSMRTTIKDILDSGRITEGAYVKKTEQLLAKYLNVKEVILVTNGTLALKLVADYLKYKYNKKMNVVVPALTFPATLNPFISDNNFKCDLCDVNDNLLIDIDNMTEAQKKKTDIIIPVHLMGYACNMDKIMKEAKKYKWIVIEDACEAFGANFKNKKVGSIGDFGCFSFFVSHNVAAGELGAIATNNTKDAKILRSMKNHGRTGSNLEFKHSYIGSNYKTTEFCAGLCYTQLLYVNELLRKRNKNAKFFFENIKNDNLEPFAVDDNFSPLGYPIRAKSKKYRDYICKQLNKNDIETRHMFPCLANQKAYKGLFKNKYKIANELEDTCFYIGIHTLLKNNDKQKILSILNGK